MSLSSPSLAAGRLPSRPLRPANAAAPSAASKAPSPFTYDPPVRGHFKEVNTGEFDLVDGIAYPTRGEAASTVVFVTSKAIASPILAKSTCPATQARALTLLRDAGYVEVSLDGKGRSPYYLNGTPYGGQGRAQASGNSEWNGEIQTAGKGVRGHVAHRYRGRFDFDVPLVPARATEVSESDRMQAGYAAWGGDAPAPTEVEALTAYGLTYRAAVDNDLARYLELQGFDESQITSIRGLAGIEADFAAHRGRFLEPGAPETPTLANGFAAVGARGSNPKGEAFANYYEFTACGGHLILTGIGVNPQ